LPHTTVCSECNGIIHSYSYGLEWQYDEEEYDLANCKDEQNRPKKGVRDTNQCLLIDTFFERAAKDKGKYSLLGHNCGDAAADFMKGVAPGLRTDVGPIHIGPLGPGGYEGGGGVPGMPGPFPPRGGWGGGYGGGGGVPGMPGPFPSPGGSGGGFGGGGGVGR